MIPPAAVRIHTQGLASRFVGRGHTRAALRGRLFRKYAAVFGTLLCALLLANGLLHGWFAYRERRAALGQIQREQAVTAATRIEQFVGETERRLRSAQPPPGIGGTLAPDERRINLLRLLAQAPEIAEVSYLDTAGREQLRLSTVTRNSMTSGIDRSHEPAFSFGRLGPAWFGPVYFREGSEPFLTVAVAEQGPSPGVTVAEVNLKVLWDTVSRIRVGERGRAYVVDAAGQLIAHPDISLVLQRTGLSSQPQVRAALTAPPDPRRRAVTGRGLDGREVLTSYATVFPPGWYVFVEQPLGEALAPLNAQVWRSIALGAAALVLAVIAALLLARQMTLPIRALQAGAARIGAGELDQRIDVRTGDELEALAASFNQMAERLHTSYTGLEATVAARTAALTLALAELEAASRHKSEFLAMMSHELRTPLNAINGFSEVLIERYFGELNDKQDEYVRDILSSGQHLLALINELLDLARVEAGRMELDTATFSLREGIGASLMMVRELAARQQIRLTADIAPEVDTITADERKVKQMLFNLLANAVKFTPAGGAIAVRAWAEGSAARIAVRDTGIGIAPEEHARVFEAFHRAETAAVQEGTGLGLALTRAFAELHGGALTLESAPGHGSTFTITLPAAVERAGAVVAR